MKKYTITFDTKHGENSISILSQSMEEVLNKLLDILKALGSDVSFITILIQEQT